MNSEWWIANEKYMDKFNNILGRFGEMETEVHICIFTIGVDERNPVTSLYAFWGLGLIYHLYLAFNIKKMNR